MLKPIVYAILTSVFLMSLPLRTANADFILGGEQGNGNFSEPGDAQVGDVSVIDQDSGGVFNARAAFGAFAGNDKGAKGRALELLKCEENNPVFDEVGSLDWQLLESTLDGQNFGSTGEFSLSSPLSGTFVISLKGAGFFSLYLFTDISHGTKIHFNMQGVSIGKNGKSPGLSHASLYTPTNFNGPTSPVPAPGSFWLLLSAGTCFFGYRVYGRRLQEIAAV